MDISDTVPERESTAFFRQENIDRIRKLIENSLTPNEVDELISQMLARADNILKTVEICSILKRLKGYLGDKKFHCGFSNHEEIGFSDLPLDSKNVSNPRFSEWRAFFMEEMNTLKEYQEIILF